MGAASVRGRCQAPGPRSQIDGGDDLISAPYRGGGDREMRELCISQGEHRVAGSVALAWPSVHFAPPSSLSFWGKLKIRCVGLQHHLRANAERRCGVYFVP